MSDDKIRTISIEELRRMGQAEGLILQGCGGPLQEWVDGINRVLTEAGILLDGSQFKDAAYFERDGLTNLLFPFEGVKLDIGRLAMWRLQTHGQFGGTWLSDYVPNRLGGFTHEQMERQKPDCPLIGADSNIFNLMGIASRTLRENGMAAEAAEMCERIRESGDYYSALNILGEYVNITSPEDMEQEMKMEYGGI